MFGSGDQERDFTYVADVVEATIAASTAEVKPGSVFNVSGGSRVSLRGLIELVAVTIGTDVPVEERPAAAGDVGITAGDNRLARETLGWSPLVDLEAGVMAQVKAAREAPSAVETVG
jgi:nucleoside-diphosphate-sugar epimerase